MIIRLVSAVVALLLLYWFVWPLLGKFLGLVIFFVIVFFLFSMGKKKTG